jgi:hypothetical protein
MAAGHIKRALSLDQPLGLPRVVLGADVLARPGAALAKSAALRSGPVELLIWVFDCVI